MASSHYLNQCWLIVSKVQWHSSDGNSTRDTSAFNRKNWLENYLSRISLESPRIQRVTDKHIHSPLPRAHELLLSSPPHVADRVPRVVASVADLQTQAAHVALAAVLPTHWSAAKRRNKIQSGSVLILDRLPVIWPIICDSSRYISAWNF